LQGMWTENWCVQVENWKTKQRCRLCGEVQGTKRKNSIRGRSPESTKPEGGVGKMRTKTACTDFKGTNAFAHNKRQGSRKKKSSYELAA